MVTKAYFNVKTSAVRMERDILKIVAKEVNDILLSVSGQVVQSAREIITRALSSSIEFDSLRSGILRSELGISNPEEALDGLLRTWSNSIHVIPKLTRRFNNGVRGGFRLVGIPANFEDVLSSGFGEYVTKKGTVIPWLEWILTHGDRIIVRDYEVDFDHPGLSRTDGAIMRRGRGWRVPPEYSGTISNNMATRAIDSSLPELEAEITRVLEG